jgi:phage-related holin
MVDAMKHFLTDLFGPASCIRNVAVLLVSWFVTAVAAYWQSAPEVVRGLFVTAGVLYLCDSIAGTALALSRRQFRSDGVGRNILKLLAYLLSIIASWALGTCIGMQDALLAWVLLIVSLREGTSFIENSAQLGFPWPRGIIAVLEKAREDAEECGPNGGTAD